MHPTTGPLTQTVCSFAGTSSHAAFTAGTPAPAFGAGRRAPALAQSGAAPGKPSAQDGAFIALLDAYRPYGGLSRMQGLTARGRIRFEGGERVVEDLVDEGRLFAFSWYGALWIPLFQLDMPGPAVATGPQRVVAELGCGFDGWALASWFVQPNEWLACDSPIECLGSRLPEVLEAARADHLAAMG